METNTTASAASDRAQAELFLASAFAEVMASQGGDLEQIEDACVSAGHELMAAAFGLALERLDGALRSQLAQGVRPHDRRSRTIATKMGDVRFSYSRCRDACGNTVVPLADALDFPWYARISPAARSFLVAAGADVSFSKSAGLLGMAGGRFRLFRWLVWKAATQRTLHLSIAPVAAMWSAQWARRNRSQSCFDSRRMASASSRRTLTTLVMTAPGADLSFAATLARSGMPD